MFSVIERNQAKKQLTTKQKAKTMKTEMTRKKNYLKWFRSIYCRNKSKIKWRLSAHWTKKRAEWKCQKIQPKIDEWMFLSCLRLQLRIDSMNENVIIRQVFDNRHKSIIIDENWLWQNVYTIGKLRLSYASLNAINGI